MFISILPSRTSAMKVNNAVVIVSNDKRCHRNDVFRPQLKMALEIHPFVKDSDNFHTVFYENVENQMFV